MKKIFMILVLSVIFSSCNYYLPLGEGTIKIIPLEDEDSLLNDEENLK